MGDIIKLTGFTDEASSNFDDQIAVTKALGWSYLSARTIGAANIHDISERDFDLVCEKIDTSSIQVAEFGTLIGNWSKKITSDWNITLQEINRCISRMQKLNVTYARIMSYAQNPWGSDQMEAERFRRLREIVARFTNAGLVAVHENCMNYGGFSAEHTLRLLDEVPGLKLIFDTGNPVFQRDRSKPPLFPWQNSYDFFKQVKHAVEHVHIKDAYLSDESENPVYTFAGEGHGHVKEILSDLIESNYNGFIAIEPHMEKVFHESDKNEDSKAAYDIYMAYGRKFEALLNSIIGNES